MPRRSHSAVLLFALAAYLAPTAHAQSTKRLANQAQAAQLSDPVLAIVSLNAQRVSLYDSNGAVLRARVSTGQTGLETPAGVYAVLQKEVEHHSNVYDDASMPFMQRITWSGIALHAGELPGYPASHGCVRMPYAFAEQIFPLTHLGMRVVISPDEFAPVAISHPFLLKPSPPDFRLTASTTSAGSSASSEARKPFQPDLEKWPVRQAEMDALKASAAAATKASEEATLRASELKATFDGSSAARAKAAKELRSADMMRRKADDQLVRAVRSLAVAQTPRPRLREEDLKAVALEASQSATQDLEEAQDELNAAENRLVLAQADSDASAESSQRVRETERAAERDYAKAREVVRSAELAKRKANERLAQAERAMFAASEPRPTKREEDAKAKALAAAMDANASYAIAAQHLKDADRRFLPIRDEYKSAENARISAAAAAQEAIRRTEPVSIFISRKTKRLYVRQAHEAVFDVPIAISDPDDPIGTHVFTAVDYSGEGDDLRWTVVSIGRASPSSTRRIRSADANGAALATDVNAASAALDRLEMPPEVLERIAGHVWPGSSLIVSDEAMSSETGEATDFIVVMSDEPQGGLKSRATEVAASRRRSYDDEEGEPRRRRFYYPSFFGFW